MLPPDVLARHQRLALDLLSVLDRTVLGQQALTRLVLGGMLAGGHVLLEGLPGLGKTELIKALATATGFSHKRIQFTPDLLPSDVTGTLVLSETPQGRTLAFRPGPLFAQVVLADEINRASPKTQSALLQAMQERQVTVFDHTHDLPRPFFVLATQNPIELDGTYPLPEAQLDRFALKATVRGIDTATLTQVLRERPDGAAPAIAPVADHSAIVELIAAVRQIALPEAVAGYIARLVNATRPEMPGAIDTVRLHVRWGASPRAALALASCARAQALLAGRPAVGFADVAALAGPVIAHRLVLSHEAGLAGTSAATVVAELTAAIPELA